MSNIGGAEGARPVKIEVPDGSDEDNNVAAVSVTALEPNNENGTTEGETLPIDHLASMGSPTSSSDPYNSFHSAATTPLGAAALVMGNTNASASRETKPSPAKLFTSTSDSTLPSAAAEQETPRTFPQILMEILCNDEENDSIAWLPHGRSFIIYKKKKFASQILPKYFKATKFTSFTRKLNRWGFTRVTRGPEMGSYYHKLFLRDDPQLCLRMSSHSSNKFQEPAALLPNPTGMPFMPYGMVPGMLPPGMTQVDVAQQNHLINQQLQQLQWQQYQLQQYQQQQHAQQDNHANGRPSASTRASGPPPQTGQQQPQISTEQQQQQRFPPNGPPTTSIGLPLHVGPMMPLAGFAPPGMPFQPLHFGGNPHTLPQETQHRSPPPVGGGNTNSTGAALNSSSQGGNDEGL